MDKAFFDLDGSTYLGRDPTRGPWSPDHCHAGPVSGAIAREVETAAGPEKALARLTVEFIRPVPMAGFRVQTRITRNGRRVATCAAELHDTDGKLCATATALLLAKGDLTVPPNPKLDFPNFDQCVTGDFSITDARHDLPFFGNQIEVRYPRDESGTTGPTRVWMRTPPLLATEPTSAFQRICPLADCGNAISRNGEIDAFDFVNADLTLHMHRQSRSEWFFSDSTSFWQETGIGQSESRIFDADGPCAYAIQSLVLGKASPKSRKRPPA